MKSNDMLRRLSSWVGVVLLDDVLDETGLGEVFGQELPDADIVLGARKSHAPEI